MRPVSGLPEAVEPRRESALPSVVDAPHLLENVVLFARVPSGEGRSHPVIPSGESRDWFLNSLEHFQTVPHEVSPRVKGSRGFSIYPEKSLPWIAERDERW